MNEIKNMADMLIACGYATEAKEVPYGLTKLKTYDVYVDSIAQSVDPYGFQPHSLPQKQALTDYTTLNK
jgi:hypothetical protein